MYNLYYLYIMYKTYDFRKNIRKAFNEASEGREVLIERYGDVFQLVAKMGEPDESGSYPRGPHDTTEDDGSKIKPNHEHTVNFKLPEVEKLNELKPDFKPCKHNADPQYCKFAKPGKPCW